MIKANKLFENFFDEDAITTMRFYLFMSDMIARIKAQNSGGEFDALIAILQAAFDNLASEVGDVDTVKNTLKGKTQTNDQVMTAFKQTMSAKRGVIADDLGGKLSEGYLRFFPQGGAEYSGATKTVMPVLVNRVFDAATDYATPLGALLTALLKSFKPNWANSRDAQLTQKGHLDEDLSQRTAYRLAAELASVQAVHTIGAKYPAETEKCLSFFDFTLLFSNHGHKDADVYEGTVAAAASHVVVNKSFTSNNTFTVSNTSGNADYFIYFSDTADGEPGSQVVDVKAGKTHHPTFTQLGGGDGKPFLIVKNLSAVNAVAYKVEVK